MPRTRRRQKQRKGGITTHQIDQLVGRSALFNNRLGFPTIEAMRQAWSLPDVKARVYRQVAEDIEACGGGRRMRPFAFWEFDAPEARDRFATEYDQLHRLGLLEPGEVPSAADRFFLKRQEREQAGRVPLLVFDEDTLRGDFPPMTEGCRFRIPFQQSAAAAFIANETTEAGVDDMRL